MEQLIEMTKVSSKGQVVLPQLIRKKLHIEEGEQLLVICGGEGIFLKKMEKPLRERFLGLMHQSQNWAKKTSLTHTDVEQAIHKVRRHSK
jgi:AbrB family looped-hinge helix DNA binding protein